MSRKTHRLRQVETAIEENPGHPPRLRLVHGCQMQSHVLVLVSSAGLQGTRCMLLPQALAACTQFCRPFAQNAHQVLACPGTLLLGCLLAPPCCTKRLACRSAFSSTSSFMHSTWRTEQPLQFPSDQNAAHLTPPRCQMQRIPTIRSKAFASAALLLRSQKALVKRLRTHHT